MASDQSGSLRPPSEKSALTRGRARRTIALTGASSFLGRNLVGLLEEDPSVHKVIAVDVRRPPTAARKTRFYEVDLTQPTVDARLTEILRSEDVDTVVHLSFLATPTHATAFAHELESVGTMHVLHACRETKIRKFVMGSQTFLYGPHASNPNYLRETSPLRGLPGTQFLDDKIDAEREVGRFASHAPDTVVSVLRFAPVLGPTVHNWLTRWLSRRFVPTVMGFDPLLQFVHEMDAVAALKLAVDRDVAGTFNVVGEGVLPVSTVVKLAGRVAVPFPHFAMARAMSALWVAGLLEAPPAFAQYLKFLCVADGGRALDALSFRPAYSTREAVLDFGGALRMRDARMLQEVHG